MNLAELREIISDSITVKEKVRDSLKIMQQLNNLIEDCILSLSSGGKIILAGNGGSFADAQHLSAEFTSRFMFDRDALASIVLGANNSAISAMANDYGYENIFSRELQAVGSRNDLFIPISTSGNSPNIIKAVQVASNMGIKVVGLSGGSGGDLAKICSCMVVPSSNTARVQESHITIGHIMCEIVEKKMFDSKK